MYIIITILGLVFCYMTGLLLCKVADEEEKIREGKDKDDMEL